MGLGKRARNRILLDNALPDQAEEFQPFVAGQAVDSVIRQRACHGRSPLGIGTILNYIVILVFLDSLPNAAGYRANPILADVEVGLRSAENSVAPVHTTRRLAMNELLQATGYAAIVYLLFNYTITFGSGRPLVEWINPGRKYLPLLAVALIGGAYGSLRIAAFKYGDKGETQLSLLHKLLSEEKAPPEIVGGLSLLTFGLAVLMTFAWCWLFLPRAPQTFNPNPKDLVSEYRRALRHYVRWAGGLDYSILCEIRQGTLRVVAEGLDAKAIAHGLNRLPGMHMPPPGPGNSMVEDQKKAWNDLAGELFRTWGDANKLLAPARQGKPVAIHYDVRYGAVFAEIVEEEIDPISETAVGVFLFAACLNEHEVSTMMAARHFTMLSQAVRHIRRGVARA